MFCESKAASSRSPSPERGRLRAAPRQHPVRARAPMAPAAAQAGVAAAASRRRRQRGGLIEAFERAHHIEGFQAAPRVASRASPSPPVALHLRTCVFLVARPPKTSRGHDATGPSKHQKGAVSSAACARIEADANKLRREGGCRVEQQQGRLQVAVPARPRDHRCAIPCAVIPLGPRQARPAPERSVKTTCSRSRSRAKFCNCNASPAVGLVRRNQARATDPHAASAGGRDCSAPRRQCAAGASACTIDSADEQRADRPTQMIQGRRTPVGPTVARMSREQDRPHCRSSILVHVAIDDDGARRQR